jgi:tRNA-Thr(GGU) m(6)t(6)A37 methyltransferase TsaA
MEFLPIGTIRSPFTTKEGMPVQPKGAKGIKGTIELKNDFIKGLKDLEGFSHIILLYHFHLSEGYKLEVTPFLDNKPRGVFATRAPKRPNSIGFSVVRLNKIENNILHIENVDIIDGTPLLDIKPFTEQFDVHKIEKNGWLDETSKDVKEMKSDLRFK